MTQVIENAAVQRFFGFFFGFFAAFANGIACSNALRTSFRRFSLRSCTRFARSAPRSTSLVSWLISKSDHYQYVSVRQYCDAHPALTRKNHLDLDIDPHTLALRAINLGLVWRNVITARRCLIALLQSLTTALIVLALLLFAQ